MGVARLLLGHFSTENAITIYEDSRKHMMFAHTLSGCDTTSSLHGIGRTKAADLIKNNAECKTLADIFLREDAIKDDKVKNRENFGFYVWSRKNENLNIVRYF